MIIKDHLADMNASGYGRIGQSLIPCNIAKLAVWESMPTAPPVIYEAPGYLT
jgi:hypothetical protein